jgi:hypothetical protein
MSTLPKSLLFLGVPNLEDALAEVPDDLVALYFEGDQPQLHHVEYEDASYVGKYVEVDPSFENLSLLRDNIISTLQLLFPNHSFSDSDITLIGVMA